MATHHRSRQLGPARNQLRTWNRVSPIRSIQRATIALAGAGADGSPETNTATITAVDTTNAVVRWVGNTAQGGSYGGAIRLALTNSTTVTASRLDHQAGTVSFEVVEFWPGVLRALQVGTITLATVATNTDTITAVDVNKSQLWHLGQEATVTTAGALDTYTCMLELTNTTTVTATKLGALGTTVVGYAVLTFW